MNPQILIDSMVRQTTVLVAQLATSGGLRAPLSHLADQVFLELSEELDAQGLSRRVSADMFGMALRTYLRKIQRLRESASARDRTLWAAVYDFVASKDVVSRKDILDRFLRDDEGLVRGVLHDLSENGLVFTTGVGAEAMFRAATRSELGRMHELRGAAIDELVWALVYREGPLRRDELETIVAVSRESLDASLARLASDGRVQTKQADGAVTWVARRFALPLGSPQGWEAAVFDHFRAVCQTIAQKLRQLTRSQPDDTIGGSTFTYEVWPGHPMEEEVKGALARFRTEHGALRNRVTQYNQTHEMPENRTRVTVYGGQNVVVEDEDEDA
jgi:predicted transcriptional regulator